MVYDDVFLYEAFTMYPPHQQVPRQDDKQKESRGSEPRHAAQFTRVAPQEQLDYKSRSGQQKAYESLRHRRQSGSSGP